MRVFRHAAIIAACLFSAGTLAQPDVDVINRGVVRVVAHEEGGYGTGTGFLINDEGFVITHHHVVAGGSGFKVYPSGTDDGLSAEVVKVYGDYDLAILEVDGLSGTPLSLSVGEPNVTDALWSVGFPGLADRLGVALDASWTQGSVSRVFRASWGGFGSEFKLVQHYTEINPGNSGGPLIDDCGRVVGVNTQGSGAGRITRDSTGNIVDIISGSGMYFASAVNAVIRVLE